jgi:hypothetical protein
MKGFHKGINLNSCTLLQNSYSTKLNLFTITYISEISYFILLFNFPTYIPLIPLPIAKILKSELLKLHSSAERKSKDEGNNQNTFVCLLVGLALYDLSAESHVLAISDALYISTN